MRRWIWVLALLCLAGCERLPADSLPETEAAAVETVAEAAAEPVEMPVFAVPEEVTVVDETAFAGVVPESVRELVIGPDVVRVDFGYLNALPALSKVTVDAGNLHYRSLEWEHAGSAVLALDGDDMLYFPHPEENWIDLLAKGLDEPYPSDEPITLYTCGAKIQLRLHRDWDDIGTWVMESIRYGNDTSTAVVPLEEAPVTVSGNLGFTAFRAGDVFVVGTEYYAWSNLYIFTGDSVIVHRKDDPALLNANGEPDGLTLFPDAAGQLCYRRTTHRMVAMQTVGWYLGFLTGPDQFWYEEGTVDIAEGQLLYTPTATHTVEEYITKWHGSMEEWFEQMRSDGYAYGFTSLEQIYAHSKSQLPGESAVPVSDAVKNQLIDDWEHNLAEVPCEALPRSADSLEELAMLALPEADSRLRFIEAFVTGDSDTMAELSIGKPEVYADYAQLDVARWMAWVETGKYGEDIVRFLFRLREPVPETLIFATETWLCYTVQEGLLGTHLSQPQIYGYGAEPVNVLHNFLVNHLVSAIPKNDNMSYNERWHLTCYLIHRFTSETKSSLTLEELQDYALLCFGIENFTPGDGHFWDGVYTCLGHGGSSQCLTILESGPISDELWSVVVQFYADPACTVRSHVYRYYMKLVEGEWVFDGYDWVTESPFTAFGWSV